MANPSEADQHEWLGKELAPKDELPQGSLANIWLDKVVISHR